MSFWFIELSFVYSIYSFPLSKMFPLLTIRSRSTIDRNLILILPFYLYDSFIVYYLSCSLCWRLSYSLFKFGQFITYWSLCWVYVYSTHFVGDFSLFRLDLIILICYSLEKKRIQHLKIIRAEIAGKFIK